MPDDDPRSGDVYYYPYLWRRQHPGADAEKDRPCCVAVRLERPLRGKTLFLLALSTSGTPEGGFGIVVPREEITRLRKLPLDLDCWLTTSECNMSDVSSPAFHPSEYLGSFSDGFMRGIVLPQVRNAVQGEINRMKDG